MTSPVRAKPFGTQITAAGSRQAPARHDHVDGPERPSGRNASPSEITPSHIMSPAQEPTRGWWTEVRLGAARTRPVPSTVRTHFPGRPVRFNPNNPPIRMSLRLGAAIVAGTPCAGRWKQTLRRRLGASARVVHARAGLACGQGCESTDRTAGWLLGIEGFHVRLAHGRASRDATTDPRAPARRARRADRCRGFASDPAGDRRSPGYVLRHITRFDERDASQHDFGRVQTCPLARSRQPCSPPNPVAAPPPQERSRVGGPGRPAPPNGDEGGPTPAAAWPQRHGRFAMARAATNAGGSGENRVGQPRFCRDSSCPTVGPPYRRPAGTRSSGVSPRTQIRCQAAVCGGRSVSSHRRRSCPHRSLALRRAPGWSSPGAATRAAPRADVRQMRRARDRRRTSERR